EGAGDLHTAEGAVVQQSAVLAGEGHALRHTLVDDLGADLRQPPRVRFAGAVVPALDGVVEETADTVAVVAVVLGGVDDALGGDRVGATRGVLVAEALHVVAGLTQGGCRRSAAQPGAHDDDRALAAVVGADQFGVEPALVPHFVQRRIGGGRIGDLFAFDV